MLTFTLETNSLIYLENDHPAAAGVRALLARHAARTACVRMVATVASERQRDGSILPNFSLFQERLAKAGLGHIELLMPVVVVDVTYVDWCVVPADDGSDEALQRKIHAVLFDSPFDYADAVLAHPVGAERDKAERRWRNRQLDVLGLHCHISSGADIFVTSDENFVKPTKRTALATLGAPMILSAVEAEAYAAAQSPRAHI